MHKKKTYIILLFSLLPNLICLSQDIPNGYYNRDIGSQYGFIYIYNDTIIFPFNWGTMSTTIYKGVLDRKKWINFVPVKNKIKSSYKIVEKKKSDSISILRFNMYTLSGTMFSDVFDGRYGNIAGFGNEVGYGLGCGLAYTTPNGIFIKKDTALVFNGKFLEVILPSDCFVNAALTVRGGGQYITVPILKDSLFFVNIFQSPLVQYKDNEKRMQYRYSAKEESIEILLNFPFTKSWQKFIKMEKPYQSFRSEWVIEHHISEMKQE